MDIEQMKADITAGTDGPWVLHDCDSFDGRATYHYQEVWSSDCDVIAQEVYRAHGDGGDANMRRIARVPELEAAYLALHAENAALRKAADELAQNAKILVSRPVSPVTGGRMVLEVDINAVKSALTAYRAATGDT